MGLVEPGIRSLERELTGALGAWATGSVAVGVALAIVGRRARLPVVRGFARQQIAWGAIDGAIAAVGAARSRGQEPDGLTLVGRSDSVSDEDRARARRLKKVLQVNSALDVGYIALGIGIAARSAKLSERSGADRQLLVGDGLGIVTQGGFLLALDQIYVRRVDRFLRW